MYKCPGCGCFLKGGNKCDLCGYQIRPEEKKETYRIPKKSKKRQAVIDSDIEFFKEIWEEREHYCEVTGEFLGNEFNVCFFSHTLGKGAYPRFRHYKKNIRLVTPYVHSLWEFSDRKDPRLKQLIEDEDLLKIEYYNQPVI